MAVVAGETKLTYRELNDRVNRLAAYLVAQGVHRDDRVGVLLSRSEKNIISMLAIWKCGAWYVPIDYTNPPQRLKFLLEDISPKVIVSEQKAADIPLYAGMPVVMFEEIPWERYG
ncbi:MAG: AMP-binding protein, partial [Flammeovirgaceae bacterium]